MVRIERPSPVWYVVTEQQNTELRSAMESHAWWEEARFYGCLAAAVILTLAALVLLAAALLLQALQPVLLAAVCIALAIASAWWANRS